jgi:glycine cleavage system protein P-like pyridoxal-binding family
LGRITDDIQLIQAAFDICHLKPKTKEAITAIRHVRTGRECQGDVDQLTKMIATTIKDYMRTHPSTSYREAYKAIIPVVQTVGDIAALDGPELDALIEQLRS